MKFPEVETLDIKNFKKSPLCYRVCCDGEGRCENSTENKGKVSGNINCPKPVSICCYSKYDSEYIVPTGCHHYFRDDC